MAGGGAGYRRAAGNANNSQGGPSNQNFIGGRFDGPSDSGSHHGSHHGSPRISPGSPMSQGSQQQGPGGPPRQNPFGQGLGYDPAKPAQKKEPIITNTRVELPSAAYNLDSIHPPTDLPMRPGMNTLGSKPIQIRVNQFKITQAPTADVYQYDVLIGSGAEKRGLVKAVFESKAVRAKMRSLINGPWLWNGDKIAWCAYKVPEVRVEVDLDAERGRPSNPNKPNVYRFILKPSKLIRLASLHAFLSRQTPFDDMCLESINFLDHLIRQHPSEQYTSIKRSFFAHGGQRFALDNVVEAMRGVYSSIRLCGLNPSMGGPSTGLAINVDVANGTFWASQDVHQAARNLCKARNRNLSYQTFRDLLLPVKDPNKNCWTWSNDFKELRKMGKLKFRVKHRGKQDDKKDYTIKRFTWLKDDWDRSPKAREGMHAKNFMFNLTDRTNNTSRPISVYDYFVQKYNIRLEHWYLPLIETTREGFFPMELCVINPNQRFQAKLGPDQTASMIKFAVTRPRDRIQAIQHGVGMLKWHSDPYLDHFGLKVDPNMTVTQARLLQPPEVQYGGTGPTSKVSPGTSGRWDLRGKKFLLSNPDPLKSWGVCVVGGCVPKATVDNFLAVLVQTYIGHGGKVATKNPVVHIMDKEDKDLAAGVYDTRKKVWAQYNAEPQILLFVLPGRDSFMYERLKKNNECRFAMVSQMLNIAHVQRAQPQYCSNVCMKINAKLGGTTSRVVDSMKGAPAFFPERTMVIGADVSHPAVGSPQASMAAITMSLDAYACRYAAAVQTNGYRVEMITPANLKHMFLRLVHKFVQIHQAGPKHIYYFRDGVSEGQYSQVLEQEVKEMKRLLAEKYGQLGANIKWTVTICTKRHHIRFFPKEGDASAADRNNNALPGTLVERDVTHPFEYDFYLCAHSAIQGTARPVHYHVILDEYKCDVNHFQRLIYNHSYQYMRSTTPVSLFPAIYYAHLASNRARAHDPAASSEGPRGGQKFEEAQQDAVNERTRKGVFKSSHSGSSFPPETMPLLALGMDDKLSEETKEKIRFSMWYI